MDFLRRKKNNKKKKVIIICLEKDGQLKEVPLKVGGKWGMLKVAKKLAAEGKNGWELRDITGDPETAGMFMGFVENYKKTNNIPIKGMVKAAGLHAVPRQIRDLLKREKKDQESS